MGMAYMKVYYDLLDAMEELSMEERGKVITFLLAYARSLSTDEDHEALQPGYLEKSEKVVAGIYRRELDRAHEAYLRRCETNRSNAQKSSGPHMHFFSDEH